MGDTVESNLCYGKNHRVRLITMEDTVESDSFSMGDADKSNPLHGMGDAGKSDSMLRVTLLSLARKFAFKK
jgi:hypothetical protein